MTPALCAASSTGAQAAPTEYRRMALATMRRLLAPMALAPHVSAVVHPLQRALEAPGPDLRKDAADTLCALALALGPDLALFVPALRKVPPILGSPGGGGGGVLLGLYRNVWGGGLRDQWWLGAGQQIWGQLGCGNSSSVCCLAAFSTGKEARRRNAQEVRGKAHPGIPVIIGSGR